MEKIEAAKQMRDVLVKEREKLDEMIDKLAIEIEQLEEENN